MIIENNKFSAHELHIFTLINIGNYVFSGLSDIIVRKELIKTDKIISNYMCFKY